MLNIVVCMKQVLDPEAPVSTFQVDAEAKRVIQRGVPPVLSPFDENALEAGLRIKDMQKCKITVISMGWGLSKAVARKSLAAGADQLVLLEDVAFKDLDGCATASILATAIRKIGEFDLIFAGVQAADTNAGVVGSGIAEILGISSVTAAREIELNNGKVIVTQVLSDGYALIEVPLPVLITVSNELGELRSINTRELIAATKKRITNWSTKELCIQPSQISQTKLVGLFIPQKESICEFIKGGTEDDLGRNLALKLRESGLI